MKIINQLICKLYDNFSFGNIRPSKSQFILAQISVSLIFLFWVAVLVKVIKAAFNIGLETSLAWYYTILAVLIFYFLNKNTWTLSQAEAFIKDDENKQTLNRMIWVFWASLIIPTILLKLI